MAGATRNAGKTILLHIGLPKTGTTSVQLLMQGNVPRLQAQGFDVYRGNLMRLNDGTPQINGVELHLSTLRPGVVTEGSCQMRFMGIDRAAVFDRTRRALHSFVAQSPAQRLIVSAEDLSFHRTAGECERLRALFPADVRFEVFLVLRDPQDWLRSYARQSAKVRARFPAYDPASAFNLRPDSWILDFAGLERCYADHVGPVTTVDYDPAMANSNLLRAFGLTPWERVDAYHENVTRVKERQEMLQRLRSTIALRTRLRRGLARLRWG